MSEATSDVPRDFASCIPVKPIGDVSGGDPFPILSDLWNLFSRKGIKTVFLSIGTSPSALADLEIAESLGCPIHILETNPGDREKWNEVSTILKNRSQDGSNSQFAFSKGVEAKWVLPKNIRVLSKDQSPNWDSNSFLTLTQTICGGMKISEEETRLDILKLDLSGGSERRFLQEMLDEGIRPSVILVRWNGTPDEFLPTTLCAGHLQNAGYRLITRAANKFLQYFNDNNIQETCSWEDVGTDNPLIASVFQASQSAQKSSAVEEPVPNDRSSA